METLEHKVIDMNGKEVGTVGLDAGVFGVRVNESLVHQVVRWQLAKRRSGTHSSLGRSDVSASNRKPWKQKGSGRARAGTAASPVWVGGGVSHGPKPRNYEFRMNKQERRQAIASVLSSKLRDGSIVILDDLAIKSGKTRDMAEVLSKIGVAEEKALLVLPSEQFSSAENGVARASKNIPGITALPVEGTNVYELVKRKFLVSTKEGISALEARAKGLTDGAAAEAA